MCVALTWTQTDSWAEAGSSAAALPPAPALSTGRSTVAGMVARTPRQFTAPTVLVLHRYPGNDALGPSPPD
jgi:hypothetical protein